MIPEGLSFRRHMKIILFLALNKISVILITESDPTSCFQLKVGSCLLVFLKNFVFPLGYFSHLCMWVVTIRNIFIANCIVCKMQLPRELWLITWESEPILHYQTSLLFSKTLWMNISGSHDEKSTCW